MSTLIKFIYDIYLHIESDTYNIYIIIQHSKQCRAHTKYMQCTYIPNTKARANIYHML